MHIDKFFDHHGLTENPFAAEEARHDLVFERMKDTTSSHPDFPKVLGRLDRPTTAVVFGEKGSGKTAIRLLIGSKVVKHNEENPDGQTLLVAYDDLNPFLDRILQQGRKRLGKRRAAKTGDGTLLAGVRLVDHQDAILGMAVTQLVDALLDTAANGPESMHLPEHAKDTVRLFPRAKRVDLGVLASLYDQPRSSARTQRRGQLGKILSLGSGWGRKLTAGFGVLAGVAAAALIVGMIVEPDAPGWVLPAAIGAGVLALVLGGTLLGRRLSLRNLARNVTRETAAVQQDRKELTQALSAFSRSDLAGVPWPLPGVHDSRYQLTNRLLEILKEFGYTGILVLVDRVDEPSAIAGRVDRMKSVVWPLLDHKFLQQDRVGVKLLLPIELRHALHRESGEFFQEARLDKQNLVDRLAWSGATLYDICTHRLRACRREDAQGEIAMTDLFDEGVERNTLMDALDQMHQPRDAFKLLYRAAMEHCRTVPEDDGAFRIHRLTLDSARRAEAQRVQDLARGYTPS